MARINKVKRDKAIAALKKAGAPAAVATSAWRMLDLDADLDPQIAELVKEDSELFDSTEDDDEPDDDTPMTVRETQIARLHGSHLARKTYRQPAQERKSTAPESAQKAAAHVRDGVNTSAPVNTPRYYSDPPKPRVDSRHSEAKPSGSVRTVMDRLGIGSGR